MLSLSSRFAVSGPRDTTLTRFASRLAVLDAAFTKRTLPIPFLATLCRFRTLWEQGTHSQPHFSMAITAGGRSCGPPASLMRLDQSLPAGLEPPPSGRWRSVLQSLQWL